jgi:hypothetical protein
VAKAKIKVPKQALSDRTQPVASTVMGKIEAPAKAAAKPVNYNTILGGSRGK